MLPLMGSSRTPAHSSPCCFTEASAEGGARALLAAEPLPVRGLCNGNCPMNWKKK